MRAQINNGTLKEYPPNAIISLGTCTGVDTFEIECEVTEDFMENFYMYEAVILEDKIVNIIKYEQDITRE